MAQLVVTPEEDAALAKETGAVTPSALFAKLKISGPALLRQEIVTVTRQQNKETKPGGSIEDIAPKKGDADLKRLYAKRLEKLQKRTTRYVHIYSKDHRVLLRPELSRAWKFLSFIVVAFPPVSSSCKLMRLTTSCTS